MAKPGRQMVYCQPPRGMVDLQVYEPLKRADFLLLQDSYECAYALIRAYAFAHQRAMDLSTASPIRINEECNGTE